MGTQRVVVDETTFQDCPTIDFFVLDSVDLLLKMPQFMLDSFRREVKPLRRFVDVKTESYFLPKESTCTMPKADNTNMRGDKETVTFVGSMHEAFKGLER